MLYIDQSQKYLRGIAIGLGIFAIVVTIALIVLSFFPQIVPSSDTYWSFWLKIASVWLATVSFTASSFAAIYNALEQRHLRLMENYPYLEMFPIHMVDSIPSPVPIAYVIPELQNFNIDYLRKVLPAHKLATSSIELRYLALVVRNVGHGQVTKLQLKGQAEVPDSLYGPISFDFTRRIDLQPNRYIILTLMSIAELPAYKLTLTSVLYEGYFTSMTKFDGPKVLKDTGPYDIPPERKVRIFTEDFINQPVGEGWRLDYWGLNNQQTDIKVMAPDKDNHYLLLSGTSHMTGAYKDLLNQLTIGSTVQITVRVKSTPGTTASFNLWCHSILTPDGKDRVTQPSTPPTDWTEISMFYTATISRDLRIHLHYLPGQGEIHVDSVQVDVVHT